MPTGYTADIADGKREISFQEFALRCARNFGALITIRDEPWDKAIPNEFVPEPYHAERLAKLNEDLAVVEAWDEVAVLKYLHEEDDKARKEYLKAKTDQKAQIDRYEAMLEKVKAWTPPTSEHDGLKKFMIQQLEQSKDFDAYEPTIPATPDPVEYKSFRKEKILKDIEWASKSYAEELERCRGRNEWVRKLRQSLGLSDAVKAEAGVREY